MTPRHVVLAVFVILLWGLTLPIGKTGVAEIPPLLFTALRFAIAAVVLVPFVAVPRGRFRHVLGVATTFGGLHFGLLFLGLEGGEASTTAIAVQTNAPFGALLAWMVLGERLGWHRAGGMALAFSGVVLLAGAPSVTANPISLLMVLGAAFCWAVSNVQIKTMGPIDPLMLNAWIVALAAPQLLVASLVFESGQIAAIAEASLTAWGAIAYTAAISSGLAYATWYWLLQKYEVNQVVPFTLLIPVFGVLFSVILLGEPLGVEKLAGGLVIVAGVSIIVLARPRADSEPEPERR